MRHWFQNLNDDGKKWFEFRGSFMNNQGKEFLRYSFWSGKALRLNFQHGNACDFSESSQIGIGLFFFTAYFTFYLPSFMYPKVKRVATWDNNKVYYAIDAREYGFYFYEWALVWKFHANPDCSSRTDPWWMHQYIHLDELVFGRRERLEDKVTEIGDIYFKLGSKEFKIDSIEWKRNRSFRQFIPYILYHKTWYSLELKINNPPQYSGKGENDWDCGDDGTYGLYCGWDGPVPGWDNRQDLARLATDKYVAGVLKDAKRYGGSQSDMGINSKDVYEYVGWKRTPDGSSEKAS